MIVTSVLYLDITRTNHLNHDNYTSACVEFIKVIDNVIDNFKFFIGNRELC